MREINWALINDAMLCASEAMRNVGAYDWGDTLDSVGAPTNAEHAAQAYLYLQFAVQDVLATPGPGKMLAPYVYNVLTVLQAASMATMYACDADPDWARASAEITRVRLESLTSALTVPCELIAGGHVRPVAT